MSAVNDAPVDGNETNTITEDTTLTVTDGATGDLLNNASDIDGGALSISAFSVAGQSGPFVGRLFYQRCRFADDQRQRQLQFRTGGQFHGQHSSSHLHRQ